MISEEQVIRYCCEDLPKIENYGQAMNDETQVWHCHHRAEILPCGMFPMDTLKKFGIYFNRPAAELVFLTKFEHLRLHNKGKTLSEEHRRKLSEANKGKKHSDETRRKISEVRKGDRHPFFGKKRSDETKRKMSEAKKGKKRGSLSEWTKRKISESMKAYYAKLKHSKYICETE